MSSVRSFLESRRYHPLAFKFVHSALRHTQQQLGRGSGSEATGHITGRELLEGIRDLGLQQFGLLCPTVFRTWGVRTTADFGHVVYQMIDCGDMRKSDSDQLSDFFDVYDFDKAFGEEYTLDTSEIFSRS